MADTPGQNGAVKQTPQAPMPSADQKIPPITDQTGEGIDVSSTPIGQTVSEGLPDTASDRTRVEFEKLRYQLGEERAQRARLEDIFKTLTTPQAPPVPQQPVFQEQPIYDSQTGLLNESVLADTQKAAIEARRLAQEAKADAERIRQEAFQMRQEAEVKEAYALYPELDPYARHGKPHDKQLEIATRRILTDSALNPQDYGLNPNQRGRGLSFLEAAQMAAKYSPQKVEEVKQQAAKEAIEGIAPKEQATLEAQSAPNAPVEPVDEQQLLTATRKGDINAMAARISRFRKNTKS